MPNVDGGARADPANGFVKFSEDRQIGTDLVIRHVADHEPERVSIDSPLTLKATIHRNEDIEVVLGVQEQRRVLRASPSRLRYRLDRVTEERRLDAGVDAFV